MDKYSAFKIGFKLRLTKSSGLKIARLDQFCNKKQNEIWNFWELTEVPKCVRNSVLIGFQQKF